MSMSSKIYKGVVKKNKGLGKKLGYPTANLEVGKHAEEGIFVGRVKIENTKLPSVIFIGAPQTFGEKEKRLEAHILDFKGDLYGKEIEVEIVKKLRDNIKFNSAQELIEQIKKDELAAREHFDL